MKMDETDPEGPREHPIATVTPAGLNPIERVLRVVVAARISLKADEAIYKVPEYDAAWKRWGKELADACIVLATIAKKENVICVPKPTSAAQ